MRKAVLAAILGAVGCGGVTPVAELSMGTDETAVRWEDARARLLDDFGEWEGPFRVRMRHGGASIVAEAESGWCYAYFAVGDSRVADLDMEVFDADGRVSGRDTMFDATPYVQHCADRDEAMTVTLRVARGSGDAAFGVLRKPD